MATVKEKTSACTWRASPCCEPRRGGRKPDLLLLHYTGMVSSSAALDWLTREDSRVSSHYLVDEAGQVTQMVQESERAWHAGKSHWAGEDDINSCSIGIEIHNPGHDFGYVDFPEAQMRALEALALDIVRRHAIPAERVLAHSDVAPSRKRDPGERFDWARLARAGVGLWVEPAPLHAQGDVAIGELQQGLKRFGYGVETTGVLDDQTRTVVAAFQRHYRPARVDGIPDASSAETLARLLAKLGTA